MKILQLRFKNLNSLAGEWLIDFTAPGFISDGIFAISGPTGSGKSTILDAICLALYGQTPRLGKITNTSNEIMSRQTGECYAAVVFQAGNRNYICHWSQQKARKKAGGVLQSPRHEISEAESGQILAERLTEVKEEVEERTGMDFNRFTQSMMLAQGGFAVFLKAGPAERAPILEQITGTEIYSNISKEVHERQRAEKEQLERLKTGMTGIVILNEEEEQTLEQELTDNQDKAINLETEKCKLTKAVEWLNGLDNLQLELATLAEEENNHVQALTAFEPKLRILNNGLKAAALEGAYATLSSIRKIQQDEGKKLKDLEEKLPVTEEKLRASSELLDKKREALKLANLDKETEWGIIQVVREKDQHIVLNYKELQETRFKLGQNEKAILREQSEKLALENSIQKLSAELSGIQDFLLKNEADSCLVNELTGIKEQIKSLKEALSNREKAQAVTGEAVKKLNTALDQHKTLEEKRNRLQKTVEGATEMVAQLRKEKQRLLGDRTLSSIQSETGKLYLELAKLQKIADLESERAQLKDLVPCPLCGSLHHPWAEGNVPGTGETERKLQELTALLAEGEKLETKLSAAESREKEVAELWKSSVHNLELSAQNLDTLSGRLRECRETEQSAAAVTEEKVTGLLLKVAPLGIDKVPGNGALLDKLYTGLEERKNNLERSLEKNKKLEGQINELKNAVSISGSRLETFKQAISGLQEEISAKTGEISGLVKVREEMYGTRDPEEEERKITGKVKAAEKESMLAESDFNQCNLQNNSLKTAITGLKQSTEERSGEIMSREAGFLELLLREGFSGEEEFMGCRLSREDLEKLSREKNALDARGGDIRSRKKEREKRLEEERAKNLTVTPMEELQSGLAETTRELTAVYQRTGALRERKEANEAAKTRNLQLRREFDLQQAVYARWFSLHLLIGSADGKKFRNFAQGITFELMVAHANRQLARLSDRYLLIRDEQEPLELNVVDNYQAGEIRTTKNLSGGESFIVSLALALGLSQMSGRKVRVDSLFLDEGFGTLDEDALDTALETLAGLRQEGKLIGVISHVAAFKDRINTRITVQPVRGGKSVISGPGVSRNVS